MSGLPTREEMIADIRRTFGGPAPAKPTGPDALLKMKMKPLRQLHARLGKMAARDDLKLTSTDETRALRQAADDRFEKALSALDALTTKGGGKMRKARAAPAVVGRIADAHAEQSPSPQVYNRSILHHVGGSLTPLHKMATWQRRNAWLDEPAIAAFERSILAYFESQLHQASPHIGTDLIRDVTGDNQIQAVIRSVLETSYLNTLHILRNRLVHQLPAVVGGAAPALAADFLMHIAFQPVALALDQSSEMPPLQALDGLSRLQAYAVTFGADVIYVPNAGSLILGQFLAAELKSKCDRDTALWVKGRTQPLSETGRALKILYLVDVADTAQAFKTFRSRHTRTFASAQFGFAALLGSGKLIQQLESEPALITYVSPKGDYRPPWDQAGGYARNDENHVFGAGSAHPFEVPDSLLDPKNYLDDLEESEGL